MAFQTHLRVLKGKSGEDILPIIFSDNYVELAPGETHTIFCSYADKDAKETNPFFVISAWNLDVTRCKATGQIVFEN